VRRLLLLVGAVILLDTLFYAALTPLLPHYADEFGLSKSGVGSLTAMYAVGALVGSIPAGLATSWFGVKKVVLAGILGMVVTTALFGFAQSVWMLDSARFLQGLASSCSWTAALAWLVADAPAGARGRLIGIAMGAALFGALLGPVVGTVASFTGIAVTFTTIALLGVALAVWAWLMPSLHEPKRQPLSLLARALRNRRVLIAIWFVTLPALGFGMINVIAPLRLHALGLGAAGIGVTWLVTAAFEAVAAPAVGYASDRRGPLAPLRAGLFGTLVAMLALATLDMRWWLLAPSVVFAGLAIGSFWAPAMSLLSDEAERTGLDYAFGFTLVNMAWAPAQIAGAAGGAALAELTSDAVPYLAIVALCVLTLAFVWRIRSSASTLPSAIASTEP
jgi:MFS family permease